MPNYEISKEDFTIYSYTYFDYEHCYFVVPKIKGLSEVTQTVALEEFDVQNEARENESFKERLIRMCWKTLGYKE